MIIGRCSIESTYDVVIPINYFMNSVFVRTAFQFTTQMDLQHSASCAEPLSYVAELELLLANSANVQH